MAFVITQNCCKDASCVPVCPVDCIRPLDDSTDMLFIDPETCIDCGACMDECPVDAIYYEEDLPAEQLNFLQINAEYFRQHPLQPAASLAPTKHAPVAPGALRVAIVGAGPAACYAAAELVEIDNVEVNVFERLPTPFGLIRYGVAPDHQNTKAIVRLFERMFASDRAACYLNVEVGEQISHQELAAHHHAVIYAVGARNGRALNIPGEDLAGVHRAADVVGWYNGHPDHRAHDIDLTGARAVVIGNGNVALDIARVLRKPPASLAATDLADHALNTLMRSGIREVVIVARRGIRDAAFSVGEFLALGNLDGVDVVMEEEDLSVHRDDGIEEKRRLDVLAHNRLAGALITEFRELPAPQRNQARFVFFDPHARELYADWNEVAADTVAMLRLDAGRYPDDEKLSALVGELSIQSVEFRSWWSKHNVERRTTGTKAYHHPLVGDLTVKYQALNPSGDPDQVLIVYTTEPGSADETALRLLANWHEGERRSEQSVRSGG